jgi:hypothetical protein
MAPLSWKDTIARKTKLSVRRHKSIHHFCPEDFLLAARMTLARDRESQRRIVSKTTII